MRARVALPSERSMMILEKVVESAAKESRDRKERSYYDPSCRQAFHSVGEALGNGSANPSPFLWVLLRSFDLRRFE